MFTARMPEVRIWDESCEEMNYLGDKTHLLIGCDGKVRSLILHMDGSPTNPHQYHVYGDMIPMLYTGVKDKNGKKVFDGDILRSDITNAIMLVTWDAENCRYIGKEPYKGGSFFYHKIDDHVVLTAEVIGNIYENIDLIKWGEKNAR